MKLTQEQADFILKEFGVDLEPGKEIRLDSKLRWDIHDRAFDIEVEELPLNEKDPWSTRCRLAVEVCNVMYEG